MGKPQINRINVSNIINFMGIGQDARLIRLKEHTKNQRRDIKILGFLLGGG